MSTVVAEADVQAGRGGQRADFDRRATGSPYADWPEAYAEDRRRGGNVTGVLIDVRLSGHPGVRGRPARPDVSTRAKRRRRYARKGG